MEYQVSGVEPAAVFRFFEEISAIPRRSGKEEQISAYLCRFAKAHGLDYIQDSLYNVVIKKPGSKDCEQVSAVMLQGHQDMVCEKESGVFHDFDKEGLSLSVEDGFLKAKGTTLGADNGIAIAMMLAILADDSLVHPPLECVFTVQEEVGLIGAAGLDRDLLQAKTMINLDSEEEGVATVSCAGGLRIELSRKTEWESASGLFGCMITVGGLPGGHSGVDIDAGRTNANKLMGRILNRLFQTVSFRLAAINGGSKDNAIPRECTAVLAFEDEKNRNEAVLLLQQTATELSAELCGNEPAFFCCCENCDLAEPGGYVMNIDFTRDLVRLLVLAPDGVQSRNVKQGGFVVSSVNLGVIRTEEKRVTVIFAPRSSVASLQEELKERFRALADTFGYETVFAGEYPGWAYAEHSPVREICCRVYHELFGSELKTEAIHAGLECGLFQEKLPGLDAIAIGPAMYDVHTPQEKLDLLSVERTYRLVTRVLAELAKHR